MEGKYTNISIWRSINPSIKMTLRLEYLNYNINKQFKAEDRPLKRKKQLHNTLTISPGTYYLTLPIKV